MTDGHGHCFISYSTADALEFATKLANELEGGYPYINVWFDKRDLRPGREWDIQIDDGLKTCKLLLFVMTKDSTNEKSVCKQEWSRALSYKKTVIPLLLHKNIQTPFRLSDRQRIDFTGEFEAGIAQLRRHIAWMASPEGELQALKDRLSDAERDIQRASAEDKPRIQTDIDELTKQIDTQQRIVDNPKAAEEQTKKNIETGLERERQPEKPTAAQIATKFINPPPGIAPSYFQNRYAETKEIVRFLHDDSQRMLTVVGRGGVGKTAIVCRLLKHLECSTLPDDLAQSFGETKVGGIVYLSESGSHRVNFSNIFYDLCKLLPAETASQLDAVYKNPQGSTESKMGSLLEQFCGRRVVLLLDNFEPLVNTETFELRDKELDEALRAFLNGTHTTVNIIITTRVAPKALNLVQPGRQRSLDLDDGLESPYAENILREMDSDGRLGLKSATNELLKRAKERTRGFPRALEALFAILASDRYTTLDELLVLPLPENVVEALVGEAFNRLDTNAQKVMQALAVYNRPVTPAAVDYLLAPHIPAMDSAPILQRLANMHFARKESGRFYLHPVDREFAFGLIGNQAIKNQELGNSDAAEFLSANHPIPRHLFNQRDLTLQAANYFAAARKPRMEWKNIDDLCSQLAEIDLRIAAGDYEKAAMVLTDIDLDFLSLWGNSKLIIKYRNIFADKIKNEESIYINNICIGNAYRTLGRHKEALNYLEQEFPSKSDPEIGPKWEGRRLSDIGHCYMNFGNYNKALEYYNMALKFAQEHNNRFDEGRWLANIGYAYNKMKNYKKSKEILESALLITKETDNKKGEADILDALAQSHYYLGNIDLCIEFREQALLISQEIGDKKGIGSRLHGLGIVYHKIGKFEIAMDLLQQALQISEDIGNIQSVSKNLNEIARLHQDQGENELAILYLKKALTIAQEIGDIKGEGICLNNLGLSYHHIGQNAKARELFKQSIGIAKTLKDKKAIINRKENLTNIENILKEENF